MPPRKYRKPSRIKFTPAKHVDIESAFETTAAELAPDQPTDLPDFEAFSLEPPPLESTPPPEKRPRAFVKAIPHAKRHRAATPSPAPPVAVRLPRIPLLLPQKEIANIRQSILLAARNRVSESLALDAASVEQTLLEELVFLFDQHIQSFGSTSSNVILSSHSTSKRPTISQTFVSPETVDSLGVAIASLQATTESLQQQVKAQQRIVQSQYIQPLISLEAEAVKIDQQYHQLRSSPAFSLVVDQSSSHWLAQKL